jgi:hypothetical protein
LFFCLAFCCLEPAASALDGLTLVAGALGGSPASTLSKTRLLLLLVATDAATVAPLTVLVAGAA